MTRTPSAQILIGRADAVLTQDTSGAYQKQAHPGKLAIAYLFPETDSFGIYYRPSDKKIGHGAARRDQGAEEERHAEEDRSQASDPRVTT